MIPQRAPSMPVRAAARPVDQPCRDWVCALLRRRGVPLPDVDDIAQEVLLALHRRGPIAIPEGQSPEEAYFAWCHGVVQRQITSYLRARGKLAPLHLCPDPGEEEPCPSPSTEDLLIAHDDTALTRAVLADLRQKHAERHAVLVAYDMEDRPIREIAATLGISPNTAWNRLRLARLEVRAAWQRLQARERGAATRTSLLSHPPRQSPQSSGTAGERCPPE